MKNMFAMIFWLFILIGFSGCKSIASTPTPTVLKNIEPNHSVCKLRSN